jgi:DNA-binding XRE family transcriptional regulator
MNVQCIETNGKAAFVVVPITQWRGLLERLEILQDSADAKAAAREESFPADFARRLRGAESSLKAWRSHRGLSLQALASACGVSRQMLSVVERGKARPSAALLGALAATLGCDMDALHR